MIGLKGFLIGNASKVNTCITIVRARAPASHQISVVKFGNLNPGKPSYPKFSSPQPPTGNIYKYNKPKTHLFKGGTKALERNININR